MKKYLLILRKFIFKAWIYNCIFFMKEALFRLLKDFNKDLFGSVSFWMFIVYMNLAWLDEVLYPKIKRFPVIVQALIIEALLYGIELVFGLFFKYILNVMPWDYTHHVIKGIPFHFKGVISVFFFIPWFFTSLFIIYLIPRLKASTDVVVKRYSMRG